MYKVLGFVFVILLMAGCMSDNDNLVLYQDGHKLIGELNQEEEIYFDDVIDFAYRDGQLFVLHQERSDQVDPVGYHAGTQEGLEIGGFIRVYDLKGSLNATPILKYENDFTRMNPWSLKCGDFEGDGMTELFVGCYRETAFYPPDRRPFLVTWDGSRIIRKWTGSYIGMDGFLQGRLLDMTGDGRDELVLTVLNDRKEPEDRIYEWGTFTFDALIENRK